MRAARLSIVIPAFNESRRLPATLAAVADYAAGALEFAEVLVVDDGSRDETRVVAEGIAGQFAAAPGGEAARCVVRVLSHHPNRGKGASVRRGMLEATEALILMIDADLSTPIEDLSKLLSALDGAEIAIGSRALAGSQITQRQSWFRESMGKVFNRLVQAVVLGGIRDTQCGFKLFRSTAARAIFSRTRIDGFAFDVEALYLARRLGLRVAEVPVRWHNSPESTVHLVRDASRMFTDLWRIRSVHRDL